MSPYRRETAIRLGALALAYGAAVWIGLVLHSYGSGQIVTWPGHGVALAAILLSPRRDWRAMLAVIFVVAALVDLLFGNAPGVGIGYAATTTLETAADAWLITRLAGDRITLQRQVEALAFVAAAFAVSGLTAALGGAVHSAASGGDFMKVAWAWWTASATGVLIVTPAIIALARPGDPRRPRRTADVLEIVVWAAVLVGTTLVVFGPERWSAEIEVRPYWLFPAILWAALRLGTTGTAVGQAAIAAIALGLTASGESRLPLGGHDLTSQLAYVEMFLCVASAIGLLLAATFAQRRHVESALRESDARYRAVADFAAEWETWASTDLGWAYVSPACERITGYSREKFLADPMLEIRIAHPDDRPLVESHFAPALPDRAPTTSLTFRIVRRDGAVRWIEHSCRPIFDDAGTFIGRRASNRDVTERKRLEDGLRESEAHLRIVSDSVPAFIAYIGADLRYRSVNRRYAEFMGIDPAEAEGRTPSEVLGVAAWARVRPYIDRVLAGEQVTYEQQLPLQGRTGTDWIRSTYVPDVRDGRVHGFVVMSQDVSEQKRRETELVESEKRYRLLTETMRDVVWAVDPETFRFMYVSPSVERMRGWTAAEVMAGPADAALTPEASVYARGVAQARAEQLRRGELSPDTYFVDELEQPCKDGSTIPTEIVTSFHLDEATGRVEVYGLTRDITERKRAEEVLRRSARMEAIGQLAGGVAHDFNNLLTAIRGFAAFLRTDLPADDPHVEDVEEIVRAADRAAELTRSLLAYSRRQVMQPRVVEPAAQIEELAPMLRRLVGEHVVLSTVDTSGGARVSVDPSQLDQVVVNLVVNARHAMPEGGQLTITTSAVSVDAGTPGLAPEARPGRFAVISVSDTGSGMDAATLDHIFEPFFSTREPGIGTGMGLATVEGIVRQSGGFVTVLSEPGAGSTFRVHLPWVDEPVEERPRPEDAAGGIPAGHETILVVEDDAMVRTFVRRTLETHGYTVIEAASGDDALALAGTTDAIGLLLTDMRMPGLQGRRLAELLTDSRPGLRVLFMTGFDEDTARRGVDAAADHAIITKPFGSEGLVRAVRRAIDGRD